MGFRYGKAVFILVIWIADPMVWRYLLSSTELDETRSTQIFHILWKVVGLKTQVWTTVNSSLSEWEEDCCRQLRRRCEQDVGKWTRHCPRKRRWGWYYLLETLLNECIEEQGRWSASRPQCIVVGVLSEAGEGGLVISIARQFQSGGVFHNNNLTHVGRSAFSRMAWKKNPKIRIWNHLDTRLHSV